MKKLTASVGTADWVRATSDSVIRAYLPKPLGGVQISPVPAEEGGTLTKAAFEKALRKVSQRRPSPPDEGTTGT